MNSIFRLAPLILIISCGTSRPHQNPSQGAFTLTVTHEAATTETATECPEGFDGSIQGRVDRSGLPGEIRIIFLMSDDGTIEQIVEADGSFLIQCIYPSSSYGLCLESNGRRACTEVSGPKAHGLLIRASSPGV